MKNALMCMCAAFAFLVAGAFAQTSTTPADQGTQSASPSMNSQQGTPAPDSTTGAQGSMSANPSTTAGTDRKIKGCIQSEGGQYVLQTKHGKDIMLTGSDVSAHVGHEVALHGMWAGGMSGMSNTSATTSGSASASGKSFNVTSVDMISDTCSMGKSSKSGMSNGTGSTTTPPQ